MGISDLVKENLNLKFVGQIASDYSTDWHTNCTTPIINSLLKGSQMSRKVTLKWCQKHEQCICGYNVIASFELPITVKMLQRLGYKPKTDKATRKRFYLCYTFDQECAARHFPS